MTMPKMTGDELTARVIKLRKDLPVILCTGYSENISEIKALKIGVKKFLQKPLESHKLLYWIREVLDGYGYRSLDCHKHGKGRRLRVYSQEFKYCRTDH